MFKLAPPPIFEKKLRANKPPRFAVVVTSSVSLVSWLEGISLCETSGNVGDFIFSIHIVNKFQMKNCLREVILHKLD
jgi:hypothetical protein